MSESDEREDAAAEPPAPPIIQPPSPDVAPVAADTTLPGMHRGGFTRLPTAPVDITTAIAPSEPGTERDLAVDWFVPQLGGSRRGIAAWALGFSITGLVVSLFVGWGFPIGIVGIVSAILALRRPLESTRMAVWALVLGVASLVYSAGWLTFAATRANIWG